MIFIHLCASARAYLAPRWIHKRFRVTRALGWFALVAGAFIFTLCPVLFIIVQPTYTVANIVPQYLLEWLLNLVFSVVYELTSLWSVTKLSAISLVRCVVLSLLFLLGGFATVEPAVARIVTPLNSTSTGASTPDTVVSFAVRTDSYFNDNPAPYMAGMLILSLAGAGSFPMFPIYSWLLLSLPAIWLVANLCWQQPRERFLHIALLHTLLLIQVCQTLKFAYLCILCM